MASVHERNPFNETFHRYCKWYDIPIDHEGFLSAKEQEIRIDLKHYRFSVESSAHLSLSLKELYDRFNAKFIFLVRRPDKVVNSYRYKGWYDQPISRKDAHLPPSYQISKEAHHFLGRILPSGEEFDHWNQMSQVGKLAWYWNALNDRVLEQLDSIPSSNWLIQKLEDISYAHYTKIADFIGFASAIDEAAYQRISSSRPNAKNSPSTKKLSQKGTKIDRTAPFTIQMWNSAEIAEFESAVSPIATELGYEYDVNRLLERSQAEAASQKAQPIKPTDSGSTDVASLIYISNGNLPSKMAHTIQVAKMGQALSRAVKSFELVTGGDVASAFRGMDDDFRNWYGIASSYRLVRIPMHWEIEYPFPVGYFNKLFAKLASLYAYLKYPALVYTRSPHVVDLMQALQVPVLWENHELINPLALERIQKRLNHRDLVGFVALSEDAAQGYIQAGLSPEDVLVVHSGVDIGNFLPYQDKLAARKALSLPQDKKIVLYSGHLYEYKGIPTLIETASLLPEHQFILVGGWKEDVDRTQTLCREKGIENVTLVGHVEQSELATYLYAADVLVIPNSRNWKLAETTSPLKLFEYMAVKRPIVASALPNITTVLRDRHNALLAEPDDPHAFKGAIAALLDDPGLSEQVAEQAAQDVQQYTWEKRVDSVLAFAAERLQTMERTRHPLWYRILVVLKVLIFH
ncbi:MAG: glycosyltransferase [Elainellaceae cyanobacterium]